MKYLIASIFIVNVPGIICSRFTKNNIYSTPFDGPACSNEALIRMLKHAINVLTDGKDLLEDILRDPKSLMQPQVIVAPSHCVADSRPPGRPGTPYGSRDPSRHDSPRYDNPRYDHPRYDSPRHDSPPHKDNGGGWGDEPYGKGERFRPKQRMPREAARIELQSGKKQEDVLSGLQVLPSMDIQADTMNLKHREPGRGSASDAFLNQINPRKQANTDGMVWNRS